MNPLSEKARAAVEALVSSADFHERRALALSLVLEHLIQSAGSRKEQAEMRRRVEQLEAAYRKVAADADRSKVISVDLSPGLPGRYGVE